jgi:hypothetical protein
MVTRTPSTPPALSDTRKQQPSEVAPELDQPNTSSPLRR